MTAGPTTRAVLSAGSNVGDRLAHLTTVVRRFADELVAVSRVYATPPWGGVDQDDFYNVTLLVEGPHTPDEWLSIGAELEQAADRTREVRWGPRTLDVDVITVSMAGTVVLSDDLRLQLPHPRAAQRAFVLVPWAEIDPEATLWTPDGVRPVTELIAALAPEEVAGVVPVADLPAVRSA
ncbi:2-amino-4-hydroxy-6-hydroxymethyldihydropteridine diphosphokinase [Gordonia rhizosphera]|uniref:2-amino-4-hydroxy-6-hydroxymethyldihydropteridine diphosphokinase n=1 Tax=Gordonia rhizosphera NBRC 16068 TaxID=1108045 RepID=K6WS47_9ACTN|nr:2-amino-4-hydroxy-6-hydroxymethyldihydropteridine diphosphokinase [Gordonia rhizosphera]GAB89364.1 2-amino-4-hydroxy-6-hydroxymethyldihydropteridine pyrophosphokinase [Gordonia rhizosphera NBRC 16068]